MGLFSWLFKRAPTAPDVAPEPDEEEVIDFIFPTELSHNFFGTAVWSSKQRYRLGWSGSKANDQGMRIEPGRYILLEGKKILVEGRITNPDQGKVADNGTFALCDTKQMNELAAHFVFST